MLLCFWSVKDFEIMMYMSKNFVRTFLFHGLVAIFTICTGTSTQANETSKIPLYPFYEIEDSEFANFFDAVSVTLMASSRDFEDFAKTRRSNFAFLSGKGFISNEVIDQKALQLIGVEKLDQSKLQSIRIGDCIIVPLRNNGEPFLLGVNSPTGTPEEDDYKCALVSYSVFFGIFDKDFLSLTIKQMIQRIFQAQWN